MPPLRYIWDGGRGTLFGSNGDLGCGLDNDDGWSEVVLPDHVLAGWRRQQCRQCLLTSGWRTPYSMKMKYPCSVLSRQKMSCTGKLSGWMRLRYPIDQVSPIRVMTVKAFCRRCLCSFRLESCFSFVLKELSDVVMINLRTTMAKMMMLKKRMSPMGTKRPTIIGIVFKKQLKNKYDKYLNSKCHYIMT